MDNIIKLFMGPFGVTPGSKVTWKEGQPFGIILGYDDRMAVIQVNEDVWPEYSTIFNSNGVTEISFQIKAIA
jgi:hypothetical protein